MVLYWPHTIFRTSWRESALSWRDWTPMSPILTPATTAMYTIIDLGSEISWTSDQRSRACCREDDIQHGSRNGNFPRCSRRCVRNLHCSQNTRSYLYSAHTHAAPPSRDCQFSFFNCRLRQTTMFCYTCSIQASTSKYSAMYTVISAIVQNAVFTCKLQDKIMKYVAISTLWFIKSASFWPKINRKLIIFCKTI